MAKRRKNGPMPIAPHRHCKECGISTSPDRTFCSEKCEKAYENKVKKGQRMNHILLAITLGVLFIVSIAPLILPR